MQTSIKIILDTRRIKKSLNSYPVKLRVTYQRKTKNYTTIYNLSRQEFSKLGASNLNAGSQKIRDDLKKLQQQAVTAAGKLAQFSFDLFFKSFIDEHPLLLKKLKVEAVATLPSLPNSFDLTEYHKRFPILNEVHPPNFISGVYCSYIRQLLIEKRLGSAMKYRDSFNTLKKFSGNVRSSDITISYLRSLKLI